MSPRPPREYTYKELSDYARRFNQDKLLTAVAQRAASLPDDAGEMPYRATPPWALAGLTARLMAVAPAADIPSLAKTSKAADAQKSTPQRS